VNAITTNVLRLDQDNFRSSLSEAEPFIHLMLWLALAGELSPADILGKRTAAWRGHSQLLLDIRQALKDELGRKGWDGLSSDLDVLTAAELADGSRARGYRATQDGRELGEFLEQAYVHANGSNLGRLMGRLGIEAGSVVLDFGGGPGHTLLLHADEARLSITLDRTARYLSAFNRVAHSRALRGVHGICGDGLELPVADNAVNAVVAKAVLYWIDERLAIREIGRVLRPGGRALLVCPTAAWFLRRAHRGVRSGRVGAVGSSVLALLQGLLLVSTERLLSVGGRVEHFRTINGTRRLGRSAGLQVIETGRLSGRYVNSDNFYAILEKR
jgi:SAM-dependent methyltransferase